MAWSGNQKAQSEADAAWRAACQKRVNKAAADKRAAKFTKRTGSRPKWLRSDGTVDYHAYLKSKAWARRKKRYFERRERRCVECGSVFYVQLHHKSYKNLGNEPDEDLEPRCGGCHANHHESDGKAIDPMTKRFLALHL